jgi:hypothetical protein
VIPRSRSTHGGARCTVPLPVVAVAVAVALTVAGCGAGVKAQDLFLLKRTGASPHAKLTLLINEEGGVQCNGGPVLKLSDHALVIAKATQEEIKEQAAGHMNLPPRSGSVFSYFLEDENGTVRFSDNSLHQPGVLRQLQLLVLETAQKVCHLPE